MMNLRPALLLSLFLCGCAASSGPGDSDWWRAEYDGYNCTRLNDELKQVGQQIDAIETQQARRMHKSLITLDGDGDTGGPADPQNLSRLQVRQGLLQGDIGKKNCT
jgi:hypothetical protein